MNRIGLWFKTLEEMGEEASIETGFTHWENNQFIGFPHSDYDGVAAIVAFLKKIDPNTDFTQITPSIPSRKKPSFFIQIRGLLKYLLRLPLNGAKIKNQKKISDYNRAISKRSFLYFSEEETLICEKIIKTKNISMNAWFIFCLSQVMRPFLTDQTKPQIWMIPISLRDHTTDMYKPSLISGFIDAYIYSEDNAVNIHNNIKIKIKNDDAWGGYLGFAFSSILGNWFLKLIIKNNYRFQMRMGVFTNLGKWGDSSMKKNYPEKTMGYAPVVYENPIGAVALTWMGTTWVSIKFHSSIDIADNDIKEILIEWKKLILNAS